MKIETKEREWDGQDLLNLVESFERPKQDIHLFVCVLHAFQKKCYALNMLEKKKQQNQTKPISGRQKLQNDVNLPTLD